jgi:hypothetical protein
MIQVLNILRDNSEMLMATLDVFVKEPTLDWQRLARYNIDYYNMATVPVFGNEPTLDWQRLARYNIDYYNMATLRVFGRSQI